MKKVFTFTFGLLLFLTACAYSSDVEPASPLNLAAFVENGVIVHLALEQDSGGQFFLAATFIAEDGYHLYSKNLPREGLNGLGRPTLLELVDGSEMKAVGALAESVKPEQAEGPAGLLIYPVGPVTLRLPVTLPEGTGWFDEQVSLTYMACTDNVCKPPLIGKLVSVRVPGAEEILP
jgi:hypothetical protein